MVLSTEDVRAIAWRIAGEVSEVCPNARPRLVETRPGVDIGWVEFEPPFAGAVAPTVMVNSDVSVEISISGEEDDAFYPNDPADVDSLARYAVDRVLEIANYGAVRVRIPGFLGPVAASWVGVPGVDKEVDRALASRFARVHRRWLPWCRAEAEAHPGVGSHKTRFDATPAHADTSPEVDRYTHGQMPMMWLRVLGLYSRVDVAIAYDLTLLDPSAAPMVAAHALVDHSDPSQALLELAGMSSDDFGPDIVDALRGALRDEGLELPDSDSAVQHDLTDFWLTCLAEEAGPVDDLVWLLNLYGEPDEVDARRGRNVAEDAIRDVWQKLFALTLFAEEAGEVPNASEAARLAEDLLRLRVGGDVGRFAGVGYVLPQAGWGR